MKNRLLKISNSFLAAILALFGITNSTSCAKEYGSPPDDYSCAYGCPQTEYNWDGTSLVTVTGKVLNETNDWIQGIQVTLKAEGCPFDAAVKNDTSITRWGGDYWVQMKFIDSCQPEKVMLYFNDLDGNSNSGSFQSDSAEVELNYDSFNSASVQLTKKLKKVQ